MSFSYATVTLLTVVVVLEATLVVVVLAGTDVVVVEATVDVEVLVPATGDGEEGLLLPPPQDHVIAAIDAAAIARTTRPMCTLLLNEPTASVTPAASLDE